MPTPKIIEEITYLAESITDEADNITTAIFAIGENLEHIQEVRDEAGVSLDALKRMQTILTAEDSPYADEMRECIDDIERCLDTIKDETAKGIETTGETVTYKKDIDGYSDQLKTYITDLSNGNDIETIKAQLELSTS